MGLKDWKEAKANKKIVKEENLINKANAQKIAKTGVVQSKEDRDRLLRASSLSIADFFISLKINVKLIVSAMVQSLLKRSLVKNKLFISSNDSLCCFM